MADWVEPFDDVLIPCPFCPAKAAYRRYLNHLNSCSKRERNALELEGHEMIICPFNPSHHILIEDSDEHILKCPNARARINSMARNPTATYDIPQFKPVSFDESRRKAADTWQHVEERKKVTKLLMEPADVNKLKRKLIENPFMFIDGYIRQGLEPGDRSMIEELQARLQKEHIQKEKKEKGAEPTVEGPFQRDSVWNAEKDEIE